MRVLIPTIMYGRWATFNVFIQGVRDLQEAFPKIGFQVLVVGTGDRKIVPKDFIYYEYPNQPLSRKAQFRLEMAKQVKADYYLFLGSDDIISPETFKYYIDWTNQGCKWIAPLDLYSWKDGNVYHSQGYKPSHPRYNESLAVGRMLSREVLDRVGWVLWPEHKERNIDKMAFDKLKRLGYRKKFFRLTDIDGFICDIKTRDNLSKWHSNWTIKGSSKHFFNDKMLKLLDKI